MTTLNKFFKKHRKSIILLLLILFELLVVLILFHIFSQKISLNSNNDLSYQDKGNIVDEIECSNGKLRINNATVNVPVKEKMSYDIAYVWGQNDTDYPTIPHTAIASYLSKDQSVLYDITLYRDSYTPNSEIKDGKSASSWFDSWKESNTDGKIQKHINAGNLHGFYISSISNGVYDKDNDQYETESYYFAVEDKDGIMVYVLEGILYDTNSLDVFRKTMSSCFNSIKIQKQTNTSPANDSSDNEVSATST